jgi:hypothetical protein
MQKASCFEKISKRAGWIEKPRISGLAPDADSAWCGHSDRANKVGESLLLEHGFEESAE